MDRLDQRLLNEFQRDFPLVPHPYAALAERLGCDETTVMLRLAALREKGVVSRIGAVFRPHAVGASTLAAMAVPPEDLERVAALVSARPEVNHNYQRDHRLNLWFVVCADGRDAVAAVLDDFERATGIVVLDLPLVEDFHIDLGFDLDFSEMGARASRPHFLAGGTPALPSSLSDCDLALVAALTDGLAPTPRPFADLGLAEDEAIARIGAMVAGGVIRRFGVVVRHHELGYRANAMAVWDVPDETVSEVGRRLAAEPAVTLCYRRPRRLPDWPYTLFCMIHGRDRAAVEAGIAAIRDRAGIGDLPHAVLFSTRRFKQTGARYGRRAAAG